MRHICPRLCALVLLASLPACFETAPEKFASLAELTSYEKKQGYVMIGHFGDGWPAEILTERVYHDKAEVILANAEAYSFDEFEGYKIKVINMKGERNAEIVVVYRSQERE